MLRQMISPFHEMGAAAHGGENIAFKLADLPFFGDIRECHYQVLQMREHVINRADRGFNPDFSPVRVNSRNSS